MQKEMHEEEKESRESSYDEELHDVLIAISVVAKRLAQKINEEK